MPGSPKTLPSRLGRRLGKTLPLSHFLAQAQRPPATPASFTTPPPSPLQPPLTDRFLRHHNYLRVSLTERCNLRCQYCMPAEGVTLSPALHLLSTREILRIAEVFALQGVCKIRLTGGEPSVRPDLVDLVGSLAAITGIAEVCMTSNGISLHRKLPALKAAGLTALNLLIDTLQPLRFAHITRRNGLSAVLQAFHAALNLGLRVKVNVVVMRGVNEDEIESFVALARDHLVEVRFIEYMPFGGNAWLEAKMHTYAETKLAASKTYPLTRVPHAHGETAKGFTNPQFRGRVGFITSMTDNFCGTCTRLRLTADGSLKVCLFGNEEVSLRDAMRTGASDAELVEIIAAAVRAKRKGHAEMGTLETMTNRPMILIGG